jgi:hypothetical protein
MLIKNMRQNKEAGWEKQVQANTAIKTKEEVEREEMQKMRMAEEKRREEDRAERRQGGGKYNQRDDYKTHQRDDRRDNYKLNKQDSKMSDGRGGRGGKKGGYEQRYQARDGPALSKQGSKPAESKKYPVKSEKIKTKMIKIFKGETEEEEKKVEEFQYVSDLLANGILSDQDDKRVTAEDILKIFILGLVDLKAEQLGESLTAFMGRWIAGSVFKGDDWQKACVAVIRELENVASDSPHLVKSFVDSTVLPLMKAGSFTFGNLDWFNEDESFDVWPQYAVAASMLDEQVKAKGEAALAAFKDSTGDKLAKMKEMFDENCIQEDFI